MPVICFKKTAKEYFNGGADVLVCFYWQFSSFDVYHVLITYSISFMTPDLHFIEFEW